MFAFLFIAPLFVMCEALYHFDDHIWSYDNQKGDGPLVWEMLSPLCGSKSINSPIRISNLVETAEPVGIVMEGTRHAEVYHRNMDHTVVTTLGSRNGLGRSDGNLKVKFQKDIKDAGISKDDLFCLDRLEWRWGVDNDHGSEHWVGKKPYPIELQFHLFDCSYTDYTAAVRASKESEQKPAKKKTGADLLSMSVFYTTSDITSITPEPIRFLISKMGLIRDPKNAFQPLRIIEFKDESKLDVNDLLPAKRDFYAYSGRMTRPPCARASWIVFRQPVIIGMINANEIRFGVFDWFMNSIKHNARPIQHFNANETGLKLYAPPAV